MGGIPMTDPSTMWLVESDPGGLGNLNLGTFDTLTDLKNWNVSSSAFIGQNLFGSGVSVGGLAYDGSKYHVLVESDPGGLGNFNLGTFDTLTGSEELERLIFHHLSAKTCLVQVSVCEDLISMGPNTTCWWNLIPADLGISILEPSTP